ncbi:MAG: phospholipase domain-containing protein [Ginsengibacter sp.]
MNIHFEYEQTKTSRGKLTGNVIVSFKNLSNENHVVDIIDNLYKNEKQSFVLNKMDTKERILDLKNNFNWYDISLKIKGNNSFEKRYAGRVETGEHSKSDPFMERGVRLISVVNYKATLSLKVFL